MKEKLFRFSKNKYFPLVVFALLITSFFLIFTRFFIKMDDGHFQGIAYDSSFDYKLFLENRYKTLSGRTVGELLLMFFIKRNIIWWQLVSSAFIVYIAWFFCKISDFLNGGISQRKRYIFCCLSMFLMIITCLNPSVFWFAGSFTYLWPFAGIIMMISAPVFYIFSQKLSVPLSVLSFAAAFLACAQEQAAAASVAIYLLLLIFILKKKLRFKLSLIFPLIVLLVGSWFLFTSPGARGRGAMEAANGFARFSEMSLIDKLFCALSTFFANSYYLSFFLILLFTALMSLCIYQLYCKRRRLKKALILVNLFAVFVCVILNAAIMIFSRSMPHIIIREAFKSGEFDLFSTALIVFGFLLTAVLLTLLIALFKKSHSLGLLVGVCVGAAFGCAMVMGLSSSIFQSGQRVFFFTNMFVIMACVLLFSSVESNKTTTAVYKASLIYSSATFIINCFAFQFFELPLMG